MPHIAVTMIPGRNREAKEKLAQKLKECLMEELRVEEKFVSVSVEDIEFKDWNDHIRKIPTESFFIKSK